MPYLVGYCQQLFVHVACTVKKCLVNFSVLFMMEEIITKKSNSTLDPVIRGMFSLIFKKLKMNRMSLKIIIIIIIIRKVFTVYYTVQCTYSTH